MTNDDDTKPRMRVLVPKSEVSTEQPTSPKPEPRPQRDRSQNPFRPMSRPQSKLEESSVRETISDTTTRDPPAPTSGFAQTSSESTTSAPQEASSPGSDLPGAVAISTPVNGPAVSAPSKVHFLKPGAHQMYNLTTEIPRGRGEQIVTWKGAMPAVTAVNGSVRDHVSYLGWHLHGATIMMGSTSSGADKAPSVDATGKVHGAIPRAISALRHQAKSAALLDPSNQDSEGLQYQFATVLILGREDHKRVLRDLSNPTTEFKKVIGASGAPTGTKITGMLHDERGSLFGLTVEFPDPVFKQNGRSSKHFIFLHSTRAIGGGKSDEALREGNLKFEANALANQFHWWISALELGNGLIGSIESTLGGTARTGRYALLESRIPRQLFAREAFEAIGIDDASWVKDHLGSECHSYRANFATTMLRTAYGDVARRLQDIPIEIANRSDATSRRARDLKAQIAILRGIQMEHPALELLKGDMSDEYWTLKREDGITKTNYHSIIDPVECNKKWNQLRRTHLGTQYTLTQSVLRSLAEGSGASASKDIADQVIDRMRSLATSSPGILPAGGYIRLTAYLHPFDESEISPATLNDAMESISGALENAGVQKVVVNLQRTPRGLDSKPKEILIHITEDQPGTNLLIVSTDDIETHKKRLLVVNPHRDPDERKIDWKSPTFGFSRLLKSCISAHQQSGHRPCESDSEIILALYRYWYTNGGRRLNSYIGGSNRPDTVNHTQGGY